MSATKKKLDTDQVATELSESAFFQPAKPQVAIATSGQVAKTVKPQVDKYTTHLAPETIKAVKRYALDNDMKDYEVVQMALDRFLSSGDESMSTQQQQSEHSEQKTTSTQVDKYTTHFDPVPGPLPSGYVPLRAFTDLHSVSRNKLEAARKAGFVAVELGKWIVDDQEVTQVLSHRGQRQLWVQFHEESGFRPCDNCPHAH